MYLIRKGVKTVSFGWLRAVDGFKNRYNHPNNINFSKDTLLILKLNQAKQLCTEIIPIRFYF